MLTVIVFVVALLVGGAIPLIVLRWFPPRPITFLGELALVVAGVVCGFAFAFAAVYVLKMIRVLIL